MDSKEKADNACTTLLHKGKIGNPDVWEVQDEQGVWIIKDFSKTCWFMWWIWGKWILRREFCILKELDGTKGVPNKVSLQDKGIKYQAILGTDLGKYKGKKLEDRFFSELEKLVFQIHQRGYVHLDLRRAANILVCENGFPAVIDFQSAVDIRGLPKILAHFLKLIDYAGVYKMWVKFGQSGPGKYRLNLLQHAQNWRNWWCLRGSILRGKWKRKRRN